MKGIVNINPGNSPFIKIFLLYSLGIIVATCIACNMMVWGIMLSLSFMATGICFLRNHNTFFTISFYTFMVVLGIFQATKKDATASHDQYAISKYTQLVGIVADEPVIKERSIRFPVKLASGIDSSDAHPLTIKAMVTLLKDSALHTPPKYGDYLTFDNKLQSVPPPYNPNEFDYRKYLANQSIRHQIFLQPSDFMIIDTTKRSWLESIMVLRRYFVQKFRKNIHHDTAFGIASALVFGHRSEMDQTTLSAFTNTGTIHVLSVSGLHVTLVFGLLTFLLRPIDRLPYGRSFRFIIILITIWTYVVLTGMAPPILRAGIMISFFVLSSWIGRQQNNINTLTASAFFILLFTPRMLWDIGFQLSYAAMIGIFLIYPLLQQYYLPRNKILKAIVEYSYVSASAQLTTAPFALYYFGQFPNYFLLANLIIAIPTIVIMYAGVALMLMPFDTPNQWLGWIVEQSTLLMYRSLQFIDDLPYATFQGIDFHGAQLSLFIILIISLFYAFNFRSRKALFGTLFLCLAIMLSFHAQFLRYQTFRGTKVYNIRKELALAAIDNGRVALFSSLDSLWDPVLMYSVHPDLKHYTRIEKVDFIKISSDSTARLDIMGNQTIFYQGGNLTPSPPELLIVRDNSIPPLDKFINIKKVILDGSSTWQNIRRIKKQLGNDSIRCYVLKDNFAYVWIRE